MRSYYEHLEALFPSTKKNLPRPTFRSSAIFPVINKTGITSRILFMGYWLLKRNIRQIASVITLRSDIGDVLHRQSLSIEDARTYRVELKDHLEAAGFSRDHEFTGSLEIEFFSTVHLVFPFPAVVINYYGPHFTSAVHTAQRVYNDYDDMVKNSQTSVPESGFNIYADDDHEPFIGMINGIESTKNGLIKMQFYNSEGEELIHEVDLGSMEPYQMRMIYPAQLVDLKTFLKGKVGAAKIFFKLNWIFPRLTVGNIQHSLPGMTLTHTYYDCSDAENDSDYWRVPESTWHPASLNAPICFDQSEFTRISFYPIYSPGTFSIDIEIYNAAGECVGKKEKALIISFPSTLLSIHLNELCAELGIVQKENLAARIIAHPEEGSRLPARIKLGVDIGGRESLMPCNICTNLFPFNPLLETKPVSFRWAPFLADQPQASLWILNASPAVHYDKVAKLEIAFHREQDAERLLREATIAPQGFLVIELEKDDELKEFFGGKVGWFTATTTNPYTGTYYLSKNPSGVVGGDHGF